MKAGTRAVRTHIPKLDCPFCAALIEFPAAQLVEGSSVQCPHCCREAKLARERIRLGEQERWRLTEQEFDDERR